MVLASSQAGQADCAIAALLVRLGVLDPAEPAALRRMAAPVVNWRGITTGCVRSAPALSDPRR
jgi:hypothetical protein